MDCDFNNYNKGYDNCMNSECFHGITKKDEPPTRLLKYYDIEKLRLVGIIVLTMIAIDIAWFDQKEDERGARLLVI